MWRPPPRELSWKDGSLHVWRLPPIPGPRLPAAAGEMLSDDEKDRCGRLIRAEDRQRCVASRAALRIVLSKYLSRAPNAVPISAGRSGKPFLDGGGELQFNIAHAGDLLLVAISRGAPVGIDVEHVRHVRGMESILDDFFGEPERAFVRLRTGTARQEAFFRLWTRREAAAKAMGLDLFDAFARCELPAFDESRSGFRITTPPPGVTDGRAAAWWIRDFIPARGYAGALCVEQENPRPAWYHLRSW